VDNSSDAPTRLGTDGQDVTPVADRHVAVGEDPVGVIRLQQALEPGGDAPPPLADLAPEAAERGARVVIDRARLVEGEAQPIAHLGRSGQRVRQRREVGARGPGRVSVRGEPGRRVDHGDELDQVGAVEDTAGGAAAVEQGSHVGHALERGGARGRERQPRLPRQLDGGVHGEGFGEGRRRRRPLATHLGECFVSQERPHRVPLGATLPDATCLHPTPHSPPPRIAGARRCVWNSGG